MNSVRDSLKAANALQKPGIDTLFSDVYEKEPKHILEQKEELRAHLKKYKDNYDLSMYQDADKWVGK